jgi:hypothetical protein
MVARRPITFLLVTLVIAVSLYYLCFHPETRMINVPSQIMDISDENITIRSSDFDIAPVADVKYLLKQSGDNVIDQSLSPSQIMDISDEKITIWSSDFHIAPVADVKHLLKLYGVNVIDKSLSGHCHLTNTCQTDLKVINTRNGITLGTCPNELRRQFYHVYSKDPEFLQTDAVLCTYAFASCVDLFLPLNRSIIVIATTRFETGRHGEMAWKRWIETLRRVAVSPYNVVAANNLYDVEYIKYFTGIQNVQLLPSFCAYVNTKYNPQRMQILVGPGRGLNAALLMQPRRVAADANIAISAIRDLYPRFEYTDLTAHPAMVLMPYQISIMSIFELYRMEVPLFVPSPELLVEWHKKYAILQERTWPGIHDKPVERSCLPRHANSTSILSDLDPNNDISSNAILQWIKFADFYQWPAITTFTSWSDLMTKLKASDFNMISKSMAKYNIEEERRTRGKWEDILSRVREGRRARSGQLPMSINIALKNAYGMSLDEASCDKIHFDTEEI